MTRYRYSHPVAIAHNEVRLTPRSGGVQQARRSQLAIDPAPSVLSQQQDFFGNTIHFFTLQAPHHEMTVTAVSDVTLWSEVPPKPADTTPWEQVRTALSQDLTATGLDAFQFVFESPYVRWDEEPPRTPRRRSRPAARSSKGPSISRVGSTPTSRTRPGRPRWRRPCTRC
jgi:transglutaminase-like putative cysteine protease